MKYLDEYRDADLVHALSRKIHKVTRNSWRLMEVCGGQTHAIVRFGLDQLLPESIELIHGPGCPVCVTPLEQIDHALEIAERPEVIFCSFGDMLRVPGSSLDLLAVRAAGGDVRTVYSPLDAVTVAVENPEREVVFFAVGFETTAPANAAAVEAARTRGCTNFSILVSHVLVPPAICAILESPENRVQGFLAAGHVCAVMGYEQYYPIAAKFQVPIVVTGFEPVDILHGVLMCVEQLEEGRFEVENQYARVVQDRGNPHARALMEKVFAVGKRNWRGIGEIPASGLVLRDAYSDFDAERRFDLSHHRVAEPEVCISGAVLQGAKKPSECPAFARECTSEHPLGAPMVSSEGACAAYYRYRTVPREPEVTR